MTDELKLKKASYHLWTFLVSKMVSALGSNVYSFGMSLYILQMTGSALNFAANMFFSVLPRALLAPVAGYVADRFPKKVVVLMGQAGAILSVSGLLIYSFLFELSIPAIYITTMFYNISGAFSGIAFSSSIANLVDEDRIQKATSFNQLSLSVASIGGPVIGGMLFGFVSMNVFLLIIMIGYTIAFILESTMNFRLYSKRNLEDDNSQKESMLESMKQGFKYLKTKPVVMMILWISLVLNFFFTALNVGSMYIFVEILKIDSHHVGFIQASGAVGMLVASIYMSVRSQVKFPILFSKRSILMMSTIMGFMALPLFVTMSYWTVIIYFIVLTLSMGAGGVLTNTPIGVMFQKEVDEQYRGRVFGLLDTMAMAMMPLGSIIFGLLYDLIPAQWILLGSCAALIIVVLTMMRPAIVEMAHPELASRSKATQLNH